MTHNIISIIIPAYQHANTLVACLDSVFAQTYKEVEVVVVNDGSTDNTLEVLEGYNDRITIIDQENQGSNNARNNGFNASSGDFVCFCDADVIMRPDMLEKLFGALQKHPEASYAYSAFKFGWKLFRGVDFSADRLRTRNFIHTTALIRRQDFPGFDPKIKRLQDWDLWLTMQDAGKVGTLVPETLFEVSVAGESRIGSSWLPSIMYKIPWSWFRWRPSSIEKYESAQKVIQKKHNL
ncbi:MAG: glycosyltransferase family A protein [Candidatus Uhrbacteria bacterium]|nr:glycosyltransferase family A protein [Candidatus Uhrbacteria bacterium]